MWIGVSHARYLLHAARLSAERAEAAEAKAAAAGEFFSDDATASGMAAVAMAAAYAEATINEVFQRASDEVRFQMQTSDRSLPRRLGERLAVYWSADDGGRGAPVLVKFDAALRLAGSPPLDKGRSPYQDMKLVLELRNWIMHNKEEWYALNTGAPSRWASALSGRFTMPPPMSSEGPLLPLNAFGSACARWAADQSEAFTTAFREAFRNRRDREWTP